ncbi:type I restriction enzyme HsdR N-terminal domain-containing protein [Bradyrhizobium arachidis]|uniref:type I restriction enzyme HsdR N-terminal domain-containing protein n=1 Tax=Bradyrhizobium arachidis TaxID=858423 RepID=UPI002161214F|nr:type I restriction enzyme HsdR N-terminal domain-containing protein [Bradyrhizobium arachidis]UVO30305.1 type I restriction enzyme HsdR N-terminal domain-containing protein [Bradyrhizobium arachidis]
MAKLSGKVAARITTQLKRYQGILSSLQKRDVSEADTVTVINDMLSEICGYDKYLHVTSQYSIRGTYVDLAVKVDEEIRFLIEVKAVGIELKDAHVKQAIDYAANEGIEWVVLTNGVNWRIYKVHFGQPIEKILVCELDAIEASAKSPEALECFGNLSREGFSKGTMAEFLLNKQVTNKFTVAAVLQTDFILEVLRREIRRMSSGVKVEVQYLRLLLQEEVIKRDLIEGDEANAALQSIRRLQRAATRKKAAAKTTDDAPIVAPVEDASASPPRAVAAS